MLYKYYAGRQQGNIDEEIGQDIVSRSIQVNPFSIVALTNT